VDVESTPATPDQCYRAVFRDAAEAILILDGDRAIIEANPSASALVGIAVDQLVGLPFERLLADPAEIHGLWRELLALGEVKREQRFATPGGPRIAECSYRASVQPDRHLCIARDVTERRLLEERLAQSEKIESIGRLAGGIAHDFNNLLTAILGYTELLLTRRAADDPERADLEEIQRAGKRASSLTHQLLAFSRKQVLMPKDVDLNQTVVSLQTMLERLIREDITLSYELAPAPAVVRIDPGQIEQVILNLVLNARDALPSGGQIRVDVARVPASLVDLRCDHPGGPAEYIRLRVADNGGGLTPEAHAHLFEPFFTTKELGKGTGLGLASVYGIVRQSHGLIAVESAPGAGSIFTMHFPAAAAAPHAERTTLAAPEAERGRETILLVEDEDAVRVVIGAVLRRQGYQVLEAATPRGAIEVFDQHASQIDLLLSDVVMPGMNGPTLAQRLIGLRPELRVLFVSGYADLSAMAVDTSSAHIDFLSKPFQASALAAKVREILARRSRRSAVAP